MYLWCNGDMGGGDDTKEVVRGRSHGTFHWVKKPYEVIIKKRLCKAVEKYLTYLRGTYFPVYY